MQQSPTEEADRIDAFLIGVAFGVIGSVMAILVIARALA